MGPWEKKIVMQGLRKMIAGCFGSPTGCEDGGSDGRGGNDGKKIRINGGKCYRFVGEHRHRHPHPRPTLFLA